MADETTVVVADTSEGTEKANATETGVENTDTSTDKSEGTTNGTQPKFTQADLDRILKERLDKAQKAADKKAEDARAEAERKAAEEQGEFKKLYEDAEKRRVEAEAKAAQIERERLLDRIAAKHALPDDLRDRLRGDSEEDLDADAEKLAALIAKPDTPKAPDLDADKRGSVKAGEMTDAREAEIRRKFRL